MGVIEFDKVFEDEIGAINRRRETLQWMQSRAALDPKPEDVDPDGTKIRRPNEHSKLIGLALSGGGVYLLAAELIWRPQTHYRALMIGVALATFGVSILWEDFLSPLAAAKRAERRAASSDLPEK